MNDVLPPVQMSLTKDSDKVSENSSSRIALFVNVDLQESTEHDRILSAHAVALSVTALESADALSSLAQTIVTSDRRLLKRRIRSLLALASTYGSTGGRSAQVGRQNTLTVNAGCMSRTLLAL